MKINKESLQLITTLVLMVVLLSCQKNLTQTDSSTTDVKKADTVAYVDRSLRIDTLQLSQQKSNLLAGPEVISKLIKKTKDFYFANSLQTKWLDEKRPNPIYYALATEIKNSSRYGLSPEDYRIEIVEEKIEQIYGSDQTPLTDVTKLDIQITELYFLFARHLRHGRIYEPGEGRNIWIRDNTNDKQDDVTLLVLSKTIKQFNETIQALQPTSQQYWRLQNALETYRSLENRTIANALILTSEKINPGDRRSAIPLIREKLALTEIHDYPNKSQVSLTDSLLYDGDLALSVKAFQRKHGLEPDGIIGAQTLKFLNQSLTEKANLIALNMERMRWLPDDFGDHYILVNIPEYKLRIYQDEKQTLEMKVIVGALRNATPVFHDSLEQIVFSPTWTIPPSIMKEEVLPRLKTDPQYYSKKNFAFYKNGMAIDPAAEPWDSSFVNVYQYRVVQNPGPENALGLVKFVMPNTMNVYLHDTPDHTPFSKNYRALSHGCVRLDDPARFAEYLLQGEKDWDLQKINQAMRAAKTKSVPLKKYYQVHIQYNTVWVDEKGEVNFREDIYGHDKRQLQQLPKPKKQTAIASL
jgi:L,D-transpeptidase YcbB